MSSARVPPSSSVVTPSNPGKTPILSRSNGQQHLIPRHSSHEDTFGTSGGRPRATSCPARLVRDAGNVYESKGDVSREGKATHIETTDGSVRAAATGVGVAHESEGCDLTSEHDFFVPRLDDSLEDAIIRDVFQKDCRDICDPLHYGLEIEGHKQRSDDLLRVVRSRVGDGSRTPTLSEDEMAPDGSRTPTLSHDEMNTLISVSNNLQLILNGSVRSLGRKDRRRYDADITQIRANLESASLIMSIKYVVDLTPAEGEDGDRVMLFIRHGNSGKATKGWGFKRNAPLSREGLRIAAALHETLGAALRHMQQQVEDRGHNVLVQSSPLHRSLQTTALVHGGTDGTILANINLREKRNRLFSSSGEPWTGPYPHPLVDVDGNTVSVEFDGAGTGYSSSDVYHAADYVRVDDTKKFKIRLPSFTCSREGKQARSLRGEDKSSVECRGNATFQLTASRTNSLTFNFSHGNFIKTSLSLLPDCNVDEMGFFQVTIATVSPFIGKDGELKKCTARVSPYTLRVDQKHMRVSLQRLPKAPDTVSKVPSRAYFCFTPVSEVPVTDCPAATA